MPQKQGLFCQRTYLLSLLFCTFLFISPIQAQNKPQQIGRLRDGRAYRIDAGGMQLVDHIAELEVHVDDLTKQLHALEDELKEKQETIQELTNGKEIPKRHIAEVSLLDNKGSRQQGARETNTSEMKNKSEERTFMAAARAPLNCESISAPLRSEISRLEKDLEKARQDIVTQSHRVETLNREHELKESFLEEQIARLQRILAEAPTKESFAQEVRLRSVQEEKYARLGQDLSAREITLRNLQDELATTKSTLLQVQSGEKNTLARLSEELSKTKAELTKAQTEKESALAAVNEELNQIQLAQKQKTNAAPEQRTRLVPSREVTPVVTLYREEKEEASHNQTLLKTKAGLGTQLSHIQQLIMERKNLLDGQRSSKKSISVKVQPLVTPSGMSLDTLRLEVANFNAHTDLSFLQKELRQIERILIEDTQLLRRLSRL